MCYYTLTPIFPDPCDNNNPRQATFNLALQLKPCATCGRPYSTWGLGSPGAMKFVSGFFVSFAAEQRAMVGELFEYTC
jgi:hypothetical protein